MYKSIFRLCEKSVRGLKSVSGRRLFLSEAYKCSETWESRLQNEIFKKVNTENLYHHLDINFKEKTHVSVIDVDLFLNSVKDYVYKNEIEDVLLRIRLCPECSILPERATHAAIRWYFENAPKEDLLNVLGDRLHFGLFPNHYLSNLLMNNFLLNKDAVSSVKIAVLQMLQEDFENPLTKVFALYSCFNYLDSPDVWESLPTTESDSGDNDDDDVVQKVRVNFIRNPYFDDHFDLTNTNHLVGKTLWMLGKSYDNSLGTACELIGLVLHEKFDNCCHILREIVEGKRNIHAEALERVKNYLIKPPKQIEKEDGKLLKTDESKKYEEKMLELLGQVEEKSVLKGDLKAEVKKLLEKAVDENEKKEIQLQTELYKQWERDRKRDIEEEVLKKKRKEIKLEIVRMKKELETEEEKLFFFDREEEIEMMLKNKEAQKNCVK